MKILLLTIISTLALNSFSQQTFVPDDTFEAYLEANAMGNGVPNDDYVTTANISGVAFMNIVSQNINDFTGLEGFVSLNTFYWQNSSGATTVDLSGNTLLEYVVFNNLPTLSSINLSQNSLMTNVSIQSTGLNTLDASQLSAVENITCTNSQLTSLTLPLFTANLNYLNVSGNQLSSLDVSQYPNLNSFDCSNNQLTCLKANNGSIFGVYDQFFGGWNYSFNCLDNNLTCVEVTVPPIGQIEYNYDAGVVFNLNCGQLTNDLIQSGAILTAEQSGTTYQWLDCDNNYAIINGETSQSYTANSSGNYAVEISSSVCYLGIDTSACIYVDCQSEIDNDVNQNGVLLSAEQNGATYQWLDCNNNYAQINGETNQSYTATTTGYYAVELTITDICGGVQVDTSSCHLVDYSGLEELTNGSVELVKIVDLIGRETPFKPNTPLIYIYSDGTTERVFKMEE